MTVSIGPPCRCAARRTRPPPVHWTVERVCFPLPLVGIDPVPHHDWARSVGGAIARGYRLRGADAEDLVATAVLVMVSRAAVFDPVRVPRGGDVSAAFRGYAHRRIVEECRLAAERLRGGGTYNRRRKAALCVVRLEDLRQRRLDSGAVRA